MRVSEIDPDPDGGDLHIGVAVSTYNAVFTDGLLAGALEALEGSGVNEVTVLRVPGALELPVAALALARAGCDGVVAVGTVIKGDTDHYEVVVHESAAGLTAASLEAGVPVTNAILAVHEAVHARERSMPGAGNKGYEAATAAVAMAGALRGLRAASHR
jgi:6,7-dimethyl-8-ribityllumazine synthase